MLPNGAAATFQQGFPLPVPVPVPANGILPATGSLLSQSEFTINLNFKNPYVETWNFAIQQALPGHWTMDVAYLGVHGVDTAATWNLNAPTSVLGGGSASQPLNILFGKTAGDTEYWDGFSSTYHALQVKLDRRFGDLVVTTAFAWQKGMDYQQGDDGALYWQIGAQRNYARDDWDRTLSYVQSYVYQLPAGKGKKWLHNGPAAWVLGNWQLTVRAHPHDRDADQHVRRQRQRLNTPGETQTADQVAPVQILHGINVGNPWFSQASFAQPTGVRFGTSGRNILSGPGLFILNASLFKTFKVRERAAVELRAETFNFTNTPKSVIRAPASPARLTVMSPALSAAAPESMAPAAAECCQVRTY